MFAPVRKMEIHVQAHILYIIKIFPSAPELSIGECPNVFYGLLQSKMESRDGALPIHSFPPLPVSHLPPHTHLWTFGID